MDQREAMAAHYGQWWEHSSDIRNVVLRRVARLVWERIPAAAPGARALELGAGRGRIVAMLLARGYSVVAVDVSPAFVAALRERFPQVEVVQGDLARFDVDERFDLVTMIEVTQNLTNVELSGLLSRLHPRTGRLLIDISNFRSLHGWWCHVRGFQAPFVHPKTPADIAALLSAADYRTEFAAGVGLVTPLSLRRGFRTPLVPAWLADLASPLDRLFPTRCHVYYLEASPGERNTVRRQEV